MIQRYSVAQLRYELGQRCIVKTDDNIVFKKFTLLVAISNSKCIGHILYEKGGMTKERLVKFLQEFYIVLIQFYTIFINLICFV